MQDRMRLCGYAGIVFIIAVALNSLIAGTPPEIDAPADEIRAYLVDNRSAILAGGFFQVVAVLFFPWFLVGLRDAVRRADDGATLSTVTVIAGVLLGTTVLVSQSIFSGLVWVDGMTETLGDDTTQLAWVMSFVVFSLGSPLIALLAGTTAIAGFRSKTVPAPVAWVAALATALSFVGFAAQFGSDLGALGFVNFIAFALFVAVTAVMMAMGRLNEPAISP